MKVLFNCSVIKNVCMRLDSSPIELEVTYTNDPDTTWMCRKSPDNISERKYHVGKIEKAYNTIKKALLNKEPFVEIEL